jgi:hypothetical protein
MMGIMKPPDFFIDPFKKKLSQDSTGNPEQAQGFMISKKNSLAAFQYLKHL